MCLGGAVVASWALTQEVAGWQVWALMLQWQIYLSLNSLISLKIFRENSINVAKKYFHYMYNMIEGNKFRVKGMMLPAKWSDVK